ncbi:putative protein EIN4-like [Capsicum annuum]|uniref:Ubiquitin-like protease family profile domain-containing protein n=1 Tax=Capsicum annuum TaxID=4072 RepID=A0A2G2ZXA0_CAPAN|nr:putative protein EIN4-like [Capsicum annuum]KAF3653135.1 putative protein EIN4-like [Capsicum annuum]PHT86594.1 hypothetical protein T459_08700 [Capsicum annuum]
MIGIKVKYEKFMGGMFSKFVYNNIWSTHEELQSLDLQMIEEFELNNAESGFSPETTIDRSEILKKAGLITDPSASQPTKRRRTVHFDAATVEEQVCEKTPSFISTRTVPIKKIPSSDSKRVHATKTTYHHPDHDLEGSTIRDEPSQDQVDEKDIMPNVEDIEKEQHQKIGDFTTENVLSKDDVEDIAIVTTFEDIVTTRLDVLVESVINQKSVNPNIGTSSTVHIRKNHKQDYDQSVIVAQNEELIINIIKGYCMPYGLPWHLADEVYVPVNCNKKFHWDLAVIALKDRRIRVYDSLSSLRNMKSINEIHKLTVMLPI